MATTGQLLSRQRWSKKRLRELNAIYSPRRTLEVTAKDVVPTLPQSLASLEGESVQKRLTALAELIGRSPRVDIAL